MKKPLEVYIHIPFCVRKCAYCDFLSFAADEKTRQEYVDMLCREIRQWQDRGDYYVSTVFFGGGTPSILPGESIARVMDALQDTFSVSKDAEITLECNPGTLEQEKLACYRACGINRLSVGLQSARAGELKTLGRIHTYRDFLDSFFLARDMGFTNINVDLMSALPGQKTADWEETLCRVLELHPEHISAYSLIIEEGTPFYERYGEQAALRDAGEDVRLLPSEEEERQMYALTNRLLREHGYLHYEISNYALPGKMCRHNCGYWQRREYKGFGLGAASLIREVRSSNTAELGQYLAGHWSKESQALCVREQMEETMFLGLRMQCGVNRAQFQRQFGVSMEETYGGVLKKLTAQGLLREKDGCVALTGRGIDVSSYVFSEFLF